MTSRTKWVNIIMSPRLIILVVAAGGLAVYLANRSTALKVEVPPYVAVIPGVSLEHIRETQKTVWEREVSGVPPAVPPEFTVQVEVDPSGKKNRLHYYVDELQGYYVQGFNVELWYKLTPDTEPEDSPLLVTANVNDFIKANETFHGCLEVVPAELRTVDADIGQSEDWAGRVVMYGDVRVQNPDHFPPLARATTCD